MKQETIAIIGAGHSGAKAAAALRKHGWLGSISLFGDEENLPYDHPPLSKAVLLGKRTTDQCALFDESWYADNRVELSLGIPVAEINRELRQVVLSDGKSVPYHRLLLATGAAPNFLNVPGSRTNGVWPLRTPQHANAIAAALRPNQRVVIVGAGVIGLEVASSAVERGCKVHVLESSSLAMGRSLPGEISSALIGEHARRGVDVRLRVRLAELHGNETITGISLESGETLGCDVVVYGVGVTPRTELAAAAGLRVDDGIRTNNLLQTDDERIFVCGDACRYDSARYGRSLRLENWRNAEDQADAAAMNMLGQRFEFDPVPWFWSNQYNFALQVVGVTALGEIVGCSVIGESRFFASVDSNGALRGAGALGPPREISIPVRKLKEAIANGKTVDPGAVDNVIAMLEEIIGPNKEN